MNEMEQLKVMLHSTGTILRKLFGIVPKRSSEKKRIKKDRCERRVVSRTELIYGLQKSAGMSLCRLDKKWLKIYHSFVQALWFLITHLETKNSFYATVKISRPYIMQWIDTKIVFWRRAFIHSKSMDAIEQMINLHVELWSCYSTCLMKEKIEDKIWLSNIQCNR